MTNEERKQWIEACKELLVKYKNGVHDASGCPFCDVAYDVAFNRHPDLSDEEIDDNVDACEYCIWSRFTQTDCISYAMKHTVYDLRTPLMQRPDWIALRIKQLPDWIKQLEEAKCDD